MTSAQQDTIGRTRKNAMAFWRFLIRPRHPAILGVVTVAAILGGSSYAVAASLTSVTASRHDTIVSISANHNLSPTGGVNTTILSLTLPGSSTERTDYVLSAYGDLVNFGPSDYTRCGVNVNGTSVAGVSTIVGAPSAAGAWGPAAFLSPFAEVGGVKIPAGTASETATLVCEHDHSNGSTPYVDAGTSMLAHRTDSLTIATE
jgi:hypothetical protein